MAFWEKYSGRIRDIKALYVLNNIFNVSKLKHNKTLYQKFGVKKPIFSSISRKDLMDKSGNMPWLDKENAKELLLNNPELQSFPADIAEQIKHWPDNGYIILKNFFSEEQVDQINLEVDRLLEVKDVDFNYSKKKIMFAFRKSEAIRNAVTNASLLKILNFLLGKKVIPFQSINFIKGSEQKAHSDFIHMSTHPEGNLIAAWVALEDTNEKNGPLFYYKGSHKLPYIYNSDFSRSSKWLFQKNTYKAYEEKIQQVIRENKLEKTDFYAKKGDVFVWHANLLHGGNTMLDPNLTRKSMVAHYFAENVICYHEISERPALFMEYPRSEVQTVEEED